MGSLSVLHVYKDYWPPVLGGIEKHVHWLSHHQAARGLHVTVLVTNPSPFPRSLRTEITRDPARGNGTVRVVRSARLFTAASTPISPSQALWQRRLSVDVVHLHFPYPPGEVANYLWGKARVTVITYHCDVVRHRFILWLYRPLLHRVLGRADAIIATSQAYVESSPLLRTYRQQVEIIPLGIDLTPFRHMDDAQARAFRQQHAAPHPEWPVVLFVGRLRYYKGVDVLLRAVAHLPDVWVWIVGRGPLEGKWRHLARELGIGHRVRFLGEVPEDVLPLVYRASDVFVLPATQRAEAFGLVLVEAMAAGLPVISTELGTGTSTVNVHGQTGLVVPPQDVEALRTALRWLLERPAERRRMGQAARERAFHEYDAVKVGDRVIALYEQLLAQTAAR